MASRRHRGDGSVYHRASDGQWVASINLGIDAETGIRRRVVRYGRTQGAALGALREARRELDRAGHGVTHVPTLDAWLTDWLDALEADKAVARSTLAGYRTKMGHVAARAGRRRLDKLEPEHVRAVYRWLAEGGHANSYITQTHRILAHAIRDAFQEGRVPRNVMELVKTPKVGNEARVTQPVTLEHLIALRAAMEGDRLASRWMFQLTLGARQGEVVGLGWEDLDLDEGTVTIRRALQRQSGRHGCGATSCGKSAGRCPKRSAGGLTFVKPKSRMSGRTLPLPPYLLEALRERHDAWLAETAEEGYRYDRKLYGPLAPEALVWAWPNGLPRDGKADWVDWTDLLVRAGVPHMGTHSSRHGVATLMSDLGLPVVVAQAILGHADPALTMRVYTHSDDAGKRKALEAVEAAWRTVEGDPGV